MKPLNLFNSNSQPSFESVNNNHWDLLASSFYHTLYNSLPFRLLVLGNQNLSSNYYIYYFSPIYTNLKQYSITNLLLAYTLPLLYIFSPTLVSSKRMTRIEHMIMREYRIRYAYTAVLN